MEPVRIIPHVLLIVVALAGTGAGQGDYVIGYFDYKDPRSNSTGLATVLKPLAGVRAVPFDIADASSMRYESWHAIIISSFASRHEAWPAFSNRERQRILDFVSSGGVLVMMCQYRKDIPEEVFLPPGVSVRRGSEDPRGLYVDPGRHPVWKHLKPRRRGRTSWVRVPNFKTGIREVFLDGFEGWRRPLRKSAGSTPRLTGGVGAALFMEHNKGEILLFQLTVDKIDRLTDRGHRAFCMDFFKSLGAHMRSRFRRPVRPLEVVRDQPDVRPEDKPEIRPDPPVRTPKMARLTGRVYVDLDGDGMRDPAEPPLPDAMVSDQVAATRTDSNGAFSLEVRRPFMRVLYVEVPDGYRLDAPWFLPPEFPPADRDLVTADFGLRPLESAPGPMVAVSLPSLTDRATLPALEKELRSIVAAAVPGVLVLVGPHPSGGRVLDAELRRVIDGLGVPVRLALSGSPAPGPRGFSRVFGPDRFSFVHGGRRCAVMGPRMPRGMRALWSRAMGADRGGVLCISATPLDQREREVLGSRDDMLALVPGDGDSTVRNMRVLGAPPLASGNTTRYRVLVFDGQGALTTTEVRRVGGALTVDDTATDTEPNRTDVPTTDPNRTETETETDPAIEDPRPELPQHVLIRGSLLKAVRRARGLEGAKNVSDVPKNPSGEKTGEARGETAGATPPPSRPEKIEPVPGAVIAHRGGALEAPENTLTAIRRAMSLGVSDVEIDVRVTRDGRVVVWHDQTVKSGPAAGKTVEDANWSELEKVNVGTADAAEGPPLLASVLALPWSVETKLMIELKVGGRNPDLVKATADLVGGSPAKDFVAWGSFDVGIVKGLYDRLAEVPLIGIVDDEADFTSFKDVPVSIWALGDRVATKTRVQDLKKDAADVWVWTVNDPARARELLSFGVDALITDRPGYFLGR